MAHQIAVRWIIAAELRQSNPCIEHLAQPPSFRAPIVTILLASAWSPPASPSGSPMVATYI